eukprot:13702612-Alexandrium_andersonii.AAC.1
MRPRNSVRPQRAAPRPLGRRLPPIPSAGQGRFASPACWGPQPLPRGISAPFSSSADALFRA